MQNYVMDDFAWLILNTRTKRQAGNDLEEAVGLCEAKELLLHSVVLKQCTRLSTRKFFVGDKF